MNVLDWKPEYSIGKAAVDAEHRELIESINALHSRLGEAAEPAQISDALGEIFAGIAAHFALEERFMREADYADYASHKDDHERLLDELAAIIDAVDTDATYDEGVLLSTLEHWFSAHFRSHDARLHDRL